MDENMYNDKLKVDLMKIKLDDNPDTAEDLRIDLLHSKLIIPVEKTDKEDEVNIALLSNAEGDNFFQAYTDIESFEKFKDHDKYDTFTISFDEYASALINEDNIKGLVFNPFTDNVPLEKEYIKYVFNSNKVRVETVKDYPKEELKVIKEVLKEVKEVKCAYLLKMFKANEPGWLLVIDTGKDKNKRIFDKIGNKVIKKIEQINLEITDINDEHIKPMLDNMKHIYKA
jgi:hypothetical protein